MVSSRKTPVKPTKHTKQALENSALIPRKTQRASSTSRVVSSHSNAAESDVLQTTEAPAKRGRPRKAVSLTPAPQPTRSGKPVVTETLSKVEALRRRARIRKSARRAAVPEVKAELKLPRAKKPVVVAPERLPPLRGHLDVRERGRLAGWASDGSGVPVRLRVLDNGITLGTVLAASYRADLEKAGIGKGHHAFEFVIEGGLSDTQDHDIRVERVEDHAALVGSPWIVRAGRKPAATGQEAAPLPRPPQECGQGYLDYAGHRRVCGWAQDAARPEGPVTVQILDNGQLVARVLANRYRGDLDAAGPGGGRHGFDCLLPVPLSPTVRHIIRVVRDHDGVELLGSPLVLDPVSELDANLQDAFSRIIQNLSGRKNSEQALQFLMEQTTALRQQMADQATGRTRKALDREVALRTGGSRGARGAGATRLAGHPAARTGTADAPRILFVDERFPDGTRDAGSQALLSHMQAARALGFDVVFAASREQVAPPAARTVLEQEKIAFWSLPFYASVEEGLRLESHSFTCVYLHRVGIVSRYMELARLYQPKARVVYSVADLHHVRLERQARELEQPELLPRAARLRLLEGLGALQANITLTHSPVEAALLQQLAPRAQVCTVPWSVPVVRKKPRMAGRRGVLFVGHYAHLPNVDAAFWLVREIMPLVWAQVPDMPCVLVGSNMPPSVQALAGLQVQALGHVPDLAPLYAQMRLGLAPLRFGAGVKGKVLDSFAAGLPCVMTPVAAEGIVLPEILKPLVAPDAAGMARLILALQDDALATEVAQAGWQFIKDECSQKSVTQALKIIFS